MSMEAERWVGEISKDQEIEEMGLPTSIDKVAQTIS
jgi:hypothetical protein